ncbi:MAG: nucleotide exchange factor GrpE [Verrucomicrobiota bacterium]
MSSAIRAADDFAAAMQQLSAEAEKTLLVVEGAHSASDNAALAQVAHEIRTLNGRLQNLEQALTNKIDSLASASTQTPDGLVSQLQKMDEQLTAICRSESVNQKLFDTLHAELLNYRDNFLHESLQKPFIHDLVLLFDDLTALSEQLGTAADEQKKRGHVTQWRDNLMNAIHSLVEILHRFEVKEIEPREFLDRSVHRVVSHEPADFAEDDGRIVMRVRRGFLWRGKLIRPEEVIAKRFS